MIHAQNTKFINAVPPEAIHADTTGFGFTEIDTNGWDYLTIVVTLGDTDIALTALSVTDADVTATSHANITGLISGTSDNIAGDTSTLPAADDDDGIFVFEIDLKTKKRFIDMTITPGDGTVGVFLSALAILSRAKEAPITATQRGCVEILRA